MWSDLQGQVVEHIAGDTDLHNTHHQTLSRPGSVLSLMGGPLVSPTKKRSSSNLWRSQSCMSDLDQEDNSQVTSAL